MRRQWAGPWRLSGGQWMRPYWQTLPTSMQTSTSPTTFTTNVVAVVRTTYYEIGPKVA